MAKLAEKVYGEALYELALEQGKQKELLDEAQVVLQVLNENPDFSKLILNPAIPATEKEKILEDVWKGRISRELLGTMLILLQKEHYDKLPQVLEYFIAKVKELEKYGICHVTTAMELTDAQKKKIEARVLETTSYEKLEMHYTVDAAVIGGMLIRIGDRVVDSTIRTKLDHLTRQLYQIKLQ